MSIDYLTEEERMNSALFQILSELELMNNIKLKELNLSREDFDKSYE